VRNQGGHGSPFKERSVKIGWKRFNPKQNLASSISRVIHPKLGNGKDCWTIKDWGKDLLTHKRKSHIAAKKGRGKYIWGGKTSQ